MEWNGTVWTFANVLGVICFPLTYVSNSASRASSTVSCCTSIVARSYRAPTRTTWPCWIRLEAWKLKAESWDSGWDCNGLFRPRRGMARFMHLRAALLARAWSIVESATRSVVLTTTSSSSTSSSTSSCVRWNTAANGFRRHSCTNLNVGLFDHHSSLKWSTTSSTIFSCQDPLSIGVGKPSDRNHTDPSGIVTAISRAKANSPTSLTRLG